LNFTFTTKNRIKKSRLLELQYQAIRQTLLTNPFGKITVKDDPENFNDMQMAELQIFKFQTVEQVATATDNQLQRVGMGAAGLRELARRYLQVKNQSSSQTEIEHTKQELAQVKEQMAALMAQLSEKKVGRPKKEE